MRGSGSRFDVRRCARPIGLAAVVLAWIAGSAILPDWLATLPAAAQEKVVARFLWVVLVLYWAALILSVGGGAILTVVLVRAQHARKPRLTAMRLLLLCASTLLGLAILEAGSAAWLVWAHRFPSLPTRFSPSPGGELRIAVIGGSSAKGQPYQEWLSIGPIVAWKLQAALPGRRVVADVLAREGATLEEMHLKLDRIPYRPDVLIVLSGHNEFQARFPWDQDADRAGGPLPYALKAVMRDHLGSPLFGMVSEAFGKYRLMAPPRFVAHDRIGPPIVRPAESQRIRDEFEQRLEAIVAWCERIGTLPVLVIPVDNESGFQPNRSVLPESVSAAERRSFARDWDGARASESDPEPAMARYRALIARQPGFAASHFRLARLLEHSGRYAEADRHYLLARDLDGFPQRCPSAFQDAFRRVAARHDGILIDGPAELRPLSPHGILDDHLVNDGHHPSLQGYVALAQAVLRELRDRRAFGWSHGPAPSIDLAECASHFGIDDQAWAAVCCKVAGFYTVTAHNCPDPSERLAKAQRYLRAAEEIAAGTPPGELGIPGIGLPAPRPEHDHTGG